MYTKNISLNMIVFFSLFIALVSAISTVIFSETPFNDHFGFSVMFIAMIGLCFNMAYIFINTLIDICNP